jgi:hypothetical protein
MSNNVGSCIERTVISYLLVSGAGLIISDSFAATFYLFGVEVFAACFSNHNGIPCFAQLFLHMKNNSHTNSSKLEIDRP